VSVQTLGDRIQFVLGIAGQIGPLGNVLAQQTIGILIGLTLPRTMRVGKEHSDGQPLSQTFVLGHLFASIVGQGFPQRDRDVPQLLRKPAPHVTGEQARK
jgi:hypothetical protein